MATITALCVYCGSEEGRNVRHVEAARSLGEAMAKRDITLVYGGGGTGLMAVLADAVLAEGGRAVGVIPLSFVFAKPLHTESSILNDQLDSVITDSMQQRKQKMFELSDGFLMFTGGMGTLDEFFEVLTLKKVGLHDKPVVVIDVDGYWELLRDLLDHMAAEGFMSEKERNLVVIVRTVEELFSALDSAPEPTMQTEFSQF